jgi:uncharacterized protein YqjF (DUF2071 family)
MEFLRTLMAACGEEGAQNLLTLGRVPQPPPLYVLLQKFEFFFHIETESQYHYCKEKENRQWPLRETNAQSAGDG